MSTSPRRKVNLFIRALKMHPTASQSYDLARRTTLLNVKYAY